MAAICIIGGSVPKTLKVKRRERKKEMLSISKDESRVGDNRYISGRGKRKKDKKIIPP